MFCLNQTWLSSQIGRALGPQAQLQEGRVPLRFVPESLRPQALLDPAPIRGTRRVQEVPL